MHRKDFLIGLAVGFIMGVIITFFLLRITGKKINEVNTVIEKNKVAITKIDQHYDSLILDTKKIKETIAAGLDSAEQSIEVVNKTVSHDSLVDLYYAHRPDKTIDREVEKQGDGFSFTKSELKYVIKQYINLNLLSDITVPGLEKQVTNLGEALVDRGKIIDLMNESIKELQEHPAECTESFWDKIKVYLAFVAGILTGGLIK